jgi:hypothetical protein
MRATSTSILLGVIAICLLAPSVWVAGQDKETDGPTGLEGSWQYVKTKDGDGEWVDLTKDLLRVKHITRTHFAYLDINPESKQVQSGGGGSCTISGDSYKEKYTYYIADVNKDGVGRAIEYTWNFKGEELHVSWSDEKGVVHLQVWRRLAKSLI